MEFGRKTTGEGILAYVKRSLNLRGRKSCSTPKGNSV